MFRRTARNALAACAGILGLAVGAFTPILHAQDTGDPDGTGPRGTSPEETEAKKPAPPPPRLGDRQGTVGREGMWPAPTEEDWAKPVLITWQRSWADAVAVSKETGKAILCCINMDGEIASEHYAGVRYRQPEVAKIYEPYVTVIASVYRHNPRDYDDQGHRIPCPRFGGVTCGEHITIEPILFEKFLDGQRVAPRHIMVELDGKETYDLYYVNDTASVFDAIHEGITERKATPSQVVRGDRPVVERVASRDVVDRRVVEKTYRESDAAARRSLLQEASKLGNAAPVEMLRLAVFGLDVELSRMARRTLAQTDSPAATDLVVDALRVPMDAQERDALVAALERIGKTSRRAQWLAVVQRGLSGNSSPMDPAGWRKALAAAVDRAAPASYERHALHRQMGVGLDAVKSSPEDPALRVESAETILALALRGQETVVEDEKTAKQFRKLLFHDARAAALEAERLGSRDWRVSGVLARVAYYEGDTETAYRRAETAVKSMPPGESGWNAATVITIFGEARFGAIKAAVKKKEKWNPEWLTDLHAAYSVLLQHPLGTEEQVLWYYDFLTWLRAHHRASRYLDAAVARFSSSSTVHDRYRRSILRQKGIRGLEPAYDALLKQDDVPPDLVWFAGFASKVTGDVHRRLRDTDRATAAYTRAVAHFERSVEVNPASRDTSDHFIALILAGRARLAYQRGDDAAATADLLASFERRAAAAGSRDGVGMTPAETAQMVLARLVDEKNDELATELRTALDQIDGDLKRPDRP